jgi:hypothetical protein
MHAARRVRLEAKLLVRNEMPAISLGWKRLIEGLAMGVAERTMEGNEKEDHNNLISSQASK